MLSRHFGKGIAPVWLVAVVLAPLEQTPPSVTTDSPYGLLRCFEAAYEVRNLGEYSALFTRDFRFHFKDADLRARYPQGWTREDEIASARHLFEGCRDGAGVLRPPAERIALDLTPLFVLPDTEKPDSQAWYQVVRVPSVRLQVRTEDGGYLVEDDPHVFWMVRGDAAWLDPDQPADPDHWYIRRWRDGDLDDWAGADPDGVAGTLGDTRGAIRGLPRRAAP